MKLYLKELILKIKNAKPIKKVLFALLVLLYIGIICICTISKKYDYTSPGTLNRVNEVIKVEDFEKEGTFYTVSVFSSTKKCSLLEYWLRSLDSKQEIKEKESIESNPTQYTLKQETAIGEANKLQSIQDSIICAFNLAKDNGYDVNLVKEYQGVMLCRMPTKFARDKEVLIELGPESLQIKDIITKIGDVTITDVDQLGEMCIDYYENYSYEANQSCPTIEIIRNNTEITLTDCNIVCLAQLGLYYKSCALDKNGSKIDNYHSDLVNYMFDKFNLKSTESTPSFEIKDTNSIGPSGGLAQTLYVYNSLTNGSISDKGYVITATGTIFHDGGVGEIGGVDKKVYTIDIYLSDYFFVPSSNYDKAMEAYNTLKNPSFEVIKVDNVKDVIDFLKGLGD